MRKDLTNTTWKCVDKDEAEYGMTCTVIDGEINPDWNGENDIEIRYEDGSISYTKLRRFIQQHTEIPAIKPT